MLTSLDRILSTIKSLNSRGENPSPKIIVGQFGTASCLLCVIINPESNQKLKHQLRKIDKLNHENYQQNVYGKKQSKDNG